jgi:hypothetical protein
MPRRRHMWGGARRTRGSRAAVTSSAVPMPKTKSRRKCAACGVHLTLGEAVVRLRLKKQYQVPCSVCSHRPAKLKFFHAACAPADINKAMGYDANAVAAAGGTPPTTAAPPPKPMSAADAALAALAAIDKAIGRKIAENRALQNDPAFQATFKTYQGCKARALRPGTDQEGQVAMKMAVKKVLDLIF